MNNNTLNNNVTDISDIIQATYTVYVSTLVNCATLALLVYTTILSMSQEIVHIWLSPKPFGVPILLYIFSRYGTLVDQVATFWLNFVPLGRLCNVLFYIEDVVTVLGYVGVQGLLIARAYSLCQGNKVVAGVLALLFFGGLGIFISNAATLSRGCSVTSPFSPVLALAENICVILTDLIVFSVCLWKVWGTWKLKREAGIQSGNDLVSVLLNQLVSRFCFVIIFTSTLLIVDQFKDDTAISIMGTIQQSLSAILLADFTLDLRQQNSVAIRAASITLPTIQIQSVASYIHRSILVEMGNNETPVQNGSVEGDGDISIGSIPDVEIGREEPESV